MSDARRLPVHELIRRAIARADADGPFMRPMQPGDVEAARVELERRLQLLSPPRCELHPFCRCHVPAVSRVLFEAVGLIKSFERQRNGDEWHRDGTVVTTTSIVFDEGRATIAIPERSHEIRRAFESRARVRLVLERISDEEE